MSIEQRVHFMLTQGKNRQIIMAHLYLIKNPNWKDQYVATLLHKAVSITNDYLPIVKTLVGLGANINILDNYLQSPLLLAMINSNYNIVTFLIAEGAEMNNQSQTGKTVLHFCVHDIQLLDKLRSPGAWLRGFHLLKKMLRSGSDPNQYDDSGETPLMLAVKLNNFYVVRELLIFGGNVHLRNPGSETCLHLLLSCSRPNKDILFELVKQKACVNCIDNQGRSVMHRILMHYQKEEEMQTPKLLVKTVTLVNWESKITFELGTNLNLGNLKEFIDDCYTEVSRMRSCNYSDSSNLCHLALNREKISRNNESPTESILDEIFGTLMKNCFNIYDDLITPYFNRKFLSEKFLNTIIYARNEMNKAVILSTDTNHLLLPQLSDQDLINMARAYSKNLLGSSKN